MKQNPIMNAVLPHTAFHCSSCGGIRRAPTSDCGIFAQHVTSIKIATRNPAQANSSIIELIAFHQIRAQQPDAIHQNVNHVVCFLKPMPTIQ
jgi:hypothetical protein